MKKFILPILACLAFVLTVSSCSLLDPVRGKTFTTSFIGVEYGYEFGTDGTYKEFSSLGDIGEGKYSFDLKTGTVIAIDAEGATTAFAYDHENKTITDTSGLLEVTFALKEE